MKLLKKLLITTLSLICCSSLVLAFTTLTKVKADSTGDYSVYFNVGSTEETNHIQTTGGSIGKIMCEGSADVDFARYLPTNEAIIYSFDLDDSIENTTIKLYGQLSYNQNLATYLEYSVDNGSTFNNIPIASNSMYKAGCTKYNVTSSDVLSNDDNTFLLKIYTPFEDATFGGIRLVSLMIGDDFEITDDTTVINPVTNGLKYFESGNSEALYCDKGRQLLMVLANGQVSYKFDLPDNWKDASISFDAVQNNTEVFVKVDGNETKITSGQSLKDILDQTQTNEIVLVCKGVSGNSIFGNFTINKLDTKTKTVFFNAGSSDEAKYIQTTGGTLGVLSAEGSTTNNIARCLAKDEYIIYSFDLDNDVTSSCITLYGHLSNGLNFATKVEYSIDDGATFNNIPYNGNQIYKVGTAKFNITSQDALSREDNKFLIKISSPFNIQETVSITSVLVGGTNEVTADETEINPITNGLYFFDSASLECCYVDNNVSKTMVLYGGYVKYTFDLPDTWTDCKFEWTNLQNSTEVYIVVGQTENKLTSGYQLSGILEGLKDNVISLKFYGTAGNSIFNHFKLIKIAEVSEEDLPIKEIFFNAGSIDEANYIKTTGGTLGLLDAQSSSSDSNIARRFAKDEYIVYSFDLENSVEKSCITLYGHLSNGGNFATKVEYSIDDGATFNDIPYSGNEIYKVGTAKFNITSQDALSREDNKFLIKISSPFNIQETVSIVSILVGGTNEVKTDSITLNPTTTGLYYFTSATDECCYCANGNPRVMVLENGNVLYTFDLPNTWEDACFTWSGLQGASEVYVVVGDTQTKITSGQKLRSILKDNTENIISLKLVGVKGHSIFDNFILSKLDVDPFEGSVGENTNTNVPVDETFINFLINTDEEASYIFNNGEINFADTHNGFGFNDAMLSWNTGTITSRLINKGQYVTYDFDLADNVTSAQLKYYGSTSLTVEVSTNLGASWSNLEKAVASYNTGYNVYNLKTTDALANTNNTFRIRFSSTTSSYLDEIAIITDLAPRSDSIYIATYSEDAIKYILSGNNNHALVNHGKYPYFFVIGADQEIVFKIPFAQGTIHKTLNATLVKDDNGDSLHVYVSLNGTNYVDLGTSDSKGGTPYTKSFVIPQELQSAETLYVKLAGARAYCANFSIAVEKTDVVTDSFEVFSANEATYSMSLSDTLFQYTDEETTILRTLPANFTFKYKFDLVDTATKAQLKLKMKGGYKISVSVDDNVYVTLDEGDCGINNETIINIYDIFDNNPSNIIYVKFETAESCLFIKNVTITTENVPDKVVDDDGDDGDDDFNYDNPGKDDDNQKNDDKKETKKGCVSTIATSISSILAVLGICLIKKKEI